MRGYLSRHSAISQSLNALANATAASGLCRLSTGYGEQRMAASAPVASSTWSRTTPNVEAGGGPAAAAARDRAAIGAATSSAGGAAAGPGGDRRVLRIVELGRPLEHGVRDVLDPVVRQIREERPGARQLVVHGGVDDGVPSGRASLAGELGFDHDGLLVSPIVDNLHAEGLRGR